MADATKKKPSAIRLDNVRVAFPNLVKPRSRKSDDGSDKEPEYGAVFILDKKKNKEAIAAIRAAIESAAEAKWNKVPKKFANPLREGDTYVDQDEEPYDGFSEDNFAISATSRSKVPCKGRQRDDIEPSAIYGGCYVNVFMSPWCWDHPKSGKGISFNLGPVQFVKDGEKFGGGIMVDPDEAFEDLGEEDDGDEDDDTDRRKKKKKRPVDDDDDDDSPL